MDTDFIIFYEHDTMFDLFITIQHAFERHNLHCSPLARDKREFRLAYTDEIRTLIVVLDTLIPHVGPPIVRSINTDYLKRLYLRPPASLEALSEVHRSAYTCVCHYYEHVKHALPYDLPFTEEELTTLRRRFNSLEVHDICVFLDELATASYRTPPFIIERKCGVSRQLSSPRLIGECIWHRTPPS